jgi:Kef-type K+ transport system membrane component KefB
MDPVVALVLAVAGILLLGALGEFIFARTRVPDVVWLVIAGILADPSPVLSRQAFLRRAFRSLEPSP